MIEISIVIATWNRRDLLARTLPTLLEQQFPAESYEIIVVIDGSTDGTAEFLRGIRTDRNLRIIEQPNRGQAAAINAGLRAARGKLVLFLDDDILCSPTLLAEHVSAPRTDRSCLAFGPVLIAPGCADPLAADWADLFCGKFFENLSPEEAATGWYQCMASANSSGPRDTLLSIGGLDESFGRGNDYDFGIRLLRAGYTFVYRPAAITHQIFAKTRAEIMKDVRDEGDSELRLCRKHPEARRRSPLASICARPSWKRTLMRTASRFSLSPEPALGVIVGLLSYFRRYPYFRRMALSFFLLQQRLATLRSAIEKAGGWDALRAEFGMRLPVLMYHDVGPYRTGFNPWLTVPPRIFERHLRWLAKNGFRTIRVSDWICYVKHGTPLPDKPILLTFDDAYVDTADFGFPLLKKYGFTGTVFAVTDEIGGTNLWDRPIGESEQPLMTAEQIRYWVSQGIEVGSHSLDHPDLRTCSDERLCDELQSSREKLTQVAGMPVTAFAYPYGYYDGRAQETTRQYFEAACTCDAGLNDLTTDPMLLKRGTVESRFTQFDLRCFVRSGATPLLTFRIHLRNAARRFRKAIVDVPQH